MIYRYKVKRDGFELFHFDVADITEDQAHYIFDCIERGQRKRWFW